MIYSRQLSRSENFLSYAEQKQKKIIYNWSGLHEIAREAQVARPNNVNQLVQLVQTATSKVSVMGTGLTFEKLMSTPLDDPEAKLISMEHFCGLIKMKKETAVFGAATPVNDVIAILATYNRMLPCSPGVIGIQTLAGAIATGTHGQGIRQSSYSDIVKSLQVVLPNGNVITVDEHTDDYPLQAFVTAMGTLGIVLQIEIAHVPRRIFFCHKFTCKIDVMLSDYHKWNEEHEYVKVS
jgi:FAD/FMN-containing dehydrogenase